MADPDTRQRRLAVALQQGRLQQLEHDRSRRGLHTLEHIELDWLDHRAALRAARRS